MLEQKSIMQDEEKYLNTTINNLIGRHNVLCDIEKIFDNDVTAYNYFDSARKEVLESGNQSYGCMLTLAIENMIEYIRDHEKTDNTDVYELQEKIRQLESENRALTAKLQTINNLAAIGLNER